MKRPKDKAKADAARRLERFDPAEARALIVGGWLTFDGYPGLRLVRSGRPVTFVYRYRSPVDDRIRRIKLGNWPRCSWERAVALWEDVRRRRDEGVDPVLERRAKRLEARQRHAAERSAAKRKAVTVEKVVRAYHAEHTKDDEGKPLAEKTRYDTLRMFESRVIPVIGERSAVSITRSDAADFLASVKIEAHALAVLLRSRLGGAWDHARDRKLLPQDHANPWREALRGKLKARSRSRFLDDPEIATLLTRLPELGAIGDVLHFALLTGARTGEVCATERGDVRDGVWSLSKTKTDAPRRVILPRQARAIVERHPDGFGVAQHALSAAVREHKRFGLRDWVPHDLRRTCRTMLARLGVREEVCEAAIGHTEGGVKGVYNLHRYEREVGEALQKWCDHLDALAQPGVVPISKAMSKTGGRRR
jgi:integrase